MKPVALAVVLLAAFADLAGAQDSCVVRGRILGYDGKPLPKARARPMEPGGRSAMTDRAGRFTLKLARPGYHVLDIAGVYHQPLLVPAILQTARPLEVEIHLQTVEYRDRFDSVSVIGEFNGYSPETAVPMTRRPDGTFAATIECKAESLRYQLMGVARDGRPTAGTQADTFFVRDRWICSIRAGHKPVEVVFDPARLPRSEAGPVVRFGDPRSASAQLQPLFAEEVARGQRVIEASQAHQAAGGDPSEFKWDWDADARRLAGQIGREREPLRRQYLLMNYSRYAAADSDSVMALRILREIPPDSWAWSLVPGGPGGVLYWAQQRSRRPDLARGYMARASEIHPDSSVRAGFLLTAMSEADLAGDKERLGRYYTRMMSEFAGSFEASIARTRFAPDRAIRVGQPAPELGFSVLDDSTVVYHVAGFRGHYLLLDFWAVWCGPCVGEMRYLHEAYDAYKDRGLALLSVSFDPSRSAVAKFRGGKWRMPWLHAFAAKGFAGDEARVFEVIGIPRPILIDPEGTIVAMEGELRGENLRSTLARLLGAGTSGQ
jgi:thiol-disulfide isomerase/thioredoxin